METPLVAPPNTNKLLEVLTLLHDGSPRLNVRQAALLCHVALRPGKTQKQIAEALRITQTAVSQIMIYLDDVGWTKGKEQVGQFNPTLYYLTPRGQTFLKILTNPLNAP